MDSLCLNPLFLKILYFINQALNIIRFVIPIILIIKLVLDIYKQIIDPNSNEFKKYLINRIMASIIIFLIPVIVNILFSIINNVLNNPYNDLKVCLEFANPDYIKELEEERDEEELQLYLDERSKNLNAYEQKVEAIKKIVESNKVREINKKTKIIDGNNNIDESSTKVGSNANNDNLIACGSGKKYNTDLFNAVRSAGYKTRGGVVAAALYLSSHIDVHIPYFWSGGHSHTYSGYADKGDNFIGVPDKWGCDVKMQYGGTDKQKDGSMYPFGMDCSGFVNWAILNGGYYTGDSSQHVSPKTGSSVFSSLGGVSVSSVKSSSAKGKIKPGDIAFKSGHVGMVVEVHDDYYMVAEEAGYDYGLIISKVKYGKRFTDIVLMDNFYSNYKKGEALWKGFK